MTPGKAQVLAVVAGLLIVVAEISSFAIAAKANADADALEGRACSTELEITTADSKSLG